MDGGKVPRADVASRLGFNTNAKKNYNQKHQFERQRVGARIWSEKFSSMSVEGRGEMMTRK